MTGRADSTIGPFARFDALCALCRRRMKAAEAELTENGRTRGSDPLGLIMNWPPVLLSVITQLCVRDSVFSIRLRHPVSRFRDEISRRGSMV
jgi:hypothetical protein